MVVRTRVVSEGPAVLAVAALRVVEALVENVVVATSAQRLGAGRVDLVTDGDFQARGPSEFTRLATELPPLLGALPLKDITTEQVAFLAARTSFDPPILVIVTRAARLAEWPQNSSPWLQAGLELEPDFVYAMLRQGHPHTLEEFLAGRASFEQSWDAAVAASIVADREIGDDLEAVDALIRWRDDHAGAAVAHAADVLRRALEDRHHCRGARRRKTTSMCSTRCRTSGCSRASRRLFITAASARSLPACAPESRR